MTLSMEFESTLNNLNKLQVAVSSMGKLLLRYSMQFNDSTTYVLSN